MNSWWSREINVVCVESEAWIKLGIVTVLQPLPADAPYPGVHRDKPEGGLRFIGANVLVANRASIGTSPNGEPPATLLARVEAQLATRKSIAKYPTFDPSLLVRVVKRIRPPLLRLQRSLVVLSERAHVGAVLEHWLHAMHPSQIIHETED